MKQLTIIKIGGNVIDDEKALSKFLSDFSKIKGLKLLVHGGGKLATQLSEKLGIETKMIEGRRITDAETLKTVTMVYAGWINKNITAQLNSKKVNAIGLCGADLFLIPSYKRKNSEINYGFVGDVLCNEINIKYLEMFLDQNIVPVIAPITSDKSGQLLNTNADTVASSLAIALSGSYKTRLVYCFEKEGVLNGEKVIPFINTKIFKHLKEKQIILNGMIPKLDNALNASEKGVDKVVIGSSTQLNKLNAGTRITY
ncbi:MAG TPA: acetylglutamate kinase [Bacteroidia bacterium]|jgi:acetylglutamate kinase|nr:acetylglutamate kinase [Bacteroidia bacterium]